MKNKTFYIYCLLVLTGVLAASVYSVFMGVRVVLDMIRNGTVRAGDYPKYVIPYTPISLALIAGVLLMPLLMYFGEMILLSGSLYRLGSGFFFEPMGPLVLAPADVGIILLSGLLCRLCLWLIQGRKKEVSG